MYRRGFSIVELIIVITVMGILLVLGVVNMRNAQANARDENRKTDAETIAVQLENFYLSGTNSSTDVSTYPTTDLTTNVQVTLRDADMKNFTAPGATSLAASFVAATTNATQTPTTSQYIYQPLQPDGTLCTTGITDCRTFSVYYRLETDSTVYKVTSKNR